MLTVACVLSEGPRRAYDRSHVRRLGEMVAEHMLQPYCFVCLDDSPFSGWWAKVSLFEPGRFSGRVLYLDLDVTVVGGLDDLADYPAPFVIIRDWNLPGFNSSVMTWDAGVADHFYTHFTPEVMGRMPGDQNWIMKKMLSAATFPRDWCLSYKRHIRDGSGVLPSDARVICFHGKPKPWEVEGAGVHDD